MYIYSHNVINYCSISLVLCFLNTACKFIIVKLVIHNLGSLSE